MNKPAHIFTVPQPIERPLQWGEFVALLGPLGCGKSMLHRGSRLARGPHRHHGKGSRTRGDRGQSGTPPPAPAEGHTVCAGGGRGLCATRRADPTRSRGRKSLLRGSDVCPYLDGYWRCSRSQTHISWRKTWSPRRWRSISPQTKRLGRWRWSSIGAVMLSSWYTVILMPVFTLKRARLWSRRHRFEPVWSIVAAPR